MPVHVEELVSEVTVLDGELPLTQDQLDRIAEYVIAQWEQRSRDRQRSRDATELRATSEPPSPVVEGGPR